MARTTTADQQDARETLLRYLSPGSTVYCALDGEPSRSGMSRKIKLFYVYVPPVTSDDIAQAAHGAVSPVGEIHSLSHLAATFMGWSLSTEGTVSIKVSGCGMDMGFHLVNSLANALGIKLVHRWI